VPSLSKVFFWNDVSRDSLSFYKWAEALNEVQQENPCEKLNCFDEKAVLVETVISNHLFLDRVKEKRYLTLR